MSLQNLFIIVEGDDDERFCQSIVRPVLEGKGVSAQIVKYAQQPARYIRRLLRSITAMQADYVLAADINSFPCKTKKKERLQKKLKFVDQRRIIVVVREIESWYLAGLDSTSCRTLGVHHLGSTDQVTKELFDNMMPGRFVSRVDFMVEALRHFQLGVGIGKNRSLAYFSDRYLS